MPEVSRRELLWRPSCLHSAIFTSYGTDYTFLAEMLRGVSLDGACPAAMRPRGVVVVDNYDHHRQLPGLDERTYTPANEAVRCHLSVVLPRFFDADAATAERTRVHHGTMHPKMWVLEFAEGGVGGRGFLRLVLSSANLGRYDAKINNQLWACDFCRADDAMQAAAQLSIKELKAELVERNMPIPAGALEKDDLQQALLRSRRADSAAFGADLRRFVRALLQSSAPKLYVQWMATLDQYELTPPAGTHLILSVPGRYSPSRRVPEAELGYRLSAGEPPVKEAELYGLLALGRHLRRGLGGRPDSERPNLVEFACSSLGELKDIMQPLLGSFHEDITKQERKKLQQVSSFNIDGRQGAFRQGAARPDLCEPAMCKLVWPTLTESLPAFSHGKGLLTIGGGKNTMTGPSDRRCKQLKNVMAHNIVQSTERSRTLHHVKMAAGIILPADGGASSLVPRGDATNGPIGPVCAWIYAGSHNLSGAAWGKMETFAGVVADDDDSSGLEDDEEEFVIMSYEVGVLLIPPSPCRFALPWRSPALTYDPTENAPFSTNRYLNILRGFHTGAFAGRLGGRISATPKEQAVEGAEQVRNRWRVLGEHEGLPLPPLLEVELGSVRKMLTLRVDAANTIRIYDHKPKPGSVGREKARHLKLSDSDRRDELPLSTHMPLTEGSLIRAVRVGDFSYGEGDEKQPHDPILGVYQVLRVEGEDPTVRHGPRYVDDLDRANFGNDRALWKLHDERPKGVLFAFLADDVGDRSRNDELLKTLARCRQPIETLCWGVMCLQPSDEAGRTTNEDGTPIDSTPLHADLIALEFGVSPATELPALVLVTADLSKSLLVCKGAEAVTALQTSGGEALHSQLMALQELPPQELKGKRTSIWQRQAEQRLSKARKAADWLRGSAIEGDKSRRHTVKLLLIEPEGIFKKQCNISVVDSAQKALAKRRKSLYGAYRTDSFLAACVPFLRALFLELPADGDPYDAASGYGDGPPAAELRSDAPDIALVTNLGHLVTKRRPGEEKLLQPAEVRRVLAKLLRRLASELGVAVEALAAKVSLFVSFRAPGIDAPATDDAAAAWASSRLEDQRRNSLIEANEEEYDAALDELVATWAHARDGEWSAAWAKPQPAMLSAALQHHGVEPEEALMVGYDFADQEAASLAGVEYIDQQYIVGVENFDAGFDVEKMNDRLVTPGKERGAQAPGNFAAVSKHQQKKSGALPTPRSPTKARK